MTEQYRVVREHLMDRWWETGEVLCKQLKPRLNEPLDHELMNGFAGVLVLIRLDASMRLRGRTLRLRADGRTAGLDRSAQSHRARDRGARRLDCTVTGIVGNARPRRAI